ncbi:hypothetical protein ACMU_00695 [Actibacterium mucosum KCTC 23349]|uniref:Nucleoside triphosphate hydrolase n=1 Tax=Actibacterium mucosum KCTC 23349 TaxID=1454373 RepID=A0A037ZQC2_9RHOB|nr:hypothetical protein ACMU_00695 [Actibacterium mucosum KCTC 23349]
MARHIGGLPDEGKRVLVALAGPPGAGKSTLCSALSSVLANDPTTPDAVVVPMDGFHFDNCILDERGQRPVKGAPQTFDGEGFVHLVQRLRVEPEVAFPVFDRADDLSRAAAGLVTEGDRIVLVEGNYLLLNRAPWNRLRGMFDLTVFLDVPMGALEERLIARWQGYGWPEDVARKRALENDIPNARTVVNNSLPADWTIRQLDGVQV